MDEHLSLISPNYWPASNVTFSFMTVRPSYIGSSDTRFNSFQPVATPTKDWIIAKLAGSQPGYESNFADVSTLHFTLVSDVGQIDIGGGMTENGRAAGYNPIPQQQYGGDIWIPPSMTAAPTSGSYDQMALLHEIGHALGLEHGNIYPDGGVPNPSPPHLPAAMDNRAYSIMSYNVDPNAVGGAEPIGLQQLDIAALQTMYGVNYNTRSSDTTYTFNTNPGILTIWDGGGTDRIDASGFTNAVSIDLQPGHFSSIGATKNVAMALVDHLPAADQARALIEHARGGAGNDTITGNAAGNALEGGAGTNRLYGMGGDDLLISRGQNDVLEGGTGNDLLWNRQSDGNTQCVFAKGYGHDGINDNPVDASGISVFLRDLAPSDVTLVVRRHDAGSTADGEPYYAYGDSFIRINETGDTLLVPWTYRPDDMRDIFDYSGDSISFSSGATWNMATFESHVTFEDISDPNAFFSIDPTLYAWQTWDLTPYF